MRVLPLFAISASFCYASYPSFDEDELELAMLGALVSVVGWIPPERVTNTIPPAVGVNVAYELCMWGRLEESRFKELSMDHVSRLHSRMMLSDIYGPGFRRNFEELDHQGIHGHEYVLDILLSRYYNWIRQFEECQRYYVQDDHLEYGF